MRNKRLLVVAVCALVATVLFLGAKQLGGTAPKNNLRDGRLGSEAPLMLEFDQPLDKGSLPTVSTKPSADLQVSLTNNNKTLVAMPSSPTAVGTIYTVTVSNIHFANGKTARTQKLKFKPAYWPLSSYTNAELGASLAAKPAAKDTNPYASFLPYSTAEFLLTYQYLQDGGGKVTPSIHLATYSNEPALLEAAYNKAGAYLASKNVDVKTAPISFSSPYLARKYNTQNID